MNRTELVKAIAEKAGCTQAAASDVMDAFGAVLNEAAAKGEKVTIPGLLTMEVVDRAARTGRNPQTGEELKIPASKGVKISAGTALKNSAKK